MQFADPKPVAVKDVSNIILITLCAFTCSFVFFSKHKYYFIALSMQGSITDSNSPFSGTPCSHSHSSHLEAACADGLWTALQELLGVKDLAQRHLSLGSMGVTFTFTFTQIYPGSPITELAILQSQAHLFTLLATTTLSVFLNSIIIYKNNMIILNLNVQLLKC